MGGSALSGNGLEGFHPEVGSLKILETTRSSLLIEAKVNVTNPTNYSAAVPYVNINLLSNDTLLGRATARNVHVVPGRNDNILVKATWDPSNSAGLEVGRELLSQYISGPFSNYDHCPLVIPNIESRLQYHPHAADARRNDPQPTTSGVSPIIHQNPNPHSKTKNARESKSSRQWQWHSQG